MAHIEDLPAPLPFYIIKLLPDLKSLDALRRASPLFYRVFRLHAVELLEYLMSETLHHSLIIEIRAHALLKSSEQGFTGCTQLYSKASNPLVRSLPTAAISKTLYRFSGYHSLSVKIMHDRLDQFRSLSHSHLVNMPDPQVVLSSPDAHPVAQTYKIGTFSPPSWLEEQRLARSLWRAYNFTLAGEPRDFMYISSSAQYYDELDDGQWCLQALHQARSHDPKPVYLSWSAPAERQCDKALTVTERAWGLDQATQRIDAERYAPGFAFFHYTCLRSVHSALRQADWTVLRQIGLGIWDLGRMVEELQLLNYPLEFPPELKPSEQTRRYIGDEGYMSPFELLFTWTELYKSALKAKE